MDEIFVGRQPILDANGDIFSFELFYRNSNRNAFPNVNPDVATIGVIVNTYFSPGFEQIATKKTFINFTSSLLATDIFDVLDPNRVVIEIVEDVKITYALMAKLEGLKNMGFKLALDDFILQRQYITFPALFQFIDYIKVDFVSNTEAQRSTIEALKGIYPHIILLAEKVETKEQFETAKSLGYELFQGYFFAKPEIVKSSKLPYDLSLHFEIIKLLNNSSPNIEEVAALVMRDVSLTYQLLTHINTYTFKSLLSANSIHHAIVRMGLEPFNKWIQFITIYQKSAKGQDETD